MKSFLQQLEEAFELYEESDELIQDSDNEEDVVEIEKNKKRTIIIQKKTFVNQYGIQIEDG